MEYSKGQFERDFIQRTLAIISQYEKYVENNVPGHEQFEVTLLINCLIGLLVVPKECFTEYFDKHDASVEDFSSWGLSKDQLIEWGYTRDRNKMLPDTEKPHTLKTLVQGMRNSACHIRFKISGNGDQITHIEFRDASGFHVRLPISTLRDFVERLAYVIIASDAVVNMR